MLGRFLVGGFVRKDSLREKRKVLGWVKVDFEIGFVWVFRVFFVGVIGKNIYLERIEFCNFSLILVVGITIEVKFFC